MLSIYFSHKACCTRKPGEDMFTEGMQMKWQVPEMCLVFMAGRMQRQTTGPQALPLSEQQHR